ncbi:MAG: response regulator [Bacteroidales bacterium]
MSATPAMAQTPHAPPTVLVVDAHYDTRLMLRLCLEMSGLHVTEAQDGSEALRVACDSLPDVIAMDMWLPEVDGYEVCRRLREDQRTRLTPIVALTSLGMPKDVVRAWDAGCNAVLVKPSSPTALVTEVRRLLGRAPTVLEPFTIRPKPDRRRTDQPRKTHEPDRRRSRS